MPNPYNLSSSGLDLYSGLTGIFGENNVVVTSGGRSAAHNKAVGGVTGSQHIGGNAIDFEVSGYTSQEVAQIVANSGMQYGQLIGYTNDNHVHIGAGTKGQDLLKKGKDYISTTWKTAKNAIGSKVGDAVKTAANAYLPGSGEVLDGLGITGECDWLCQFKKWMKETEFFQRTGLVVLSIVLIFSAFYLFGRK